MAPVGDQGTLPFYWQALVYPIIALVACTPCGNGLPNLVPVKGTVCVTGSSAVRYTPTSPGIPVVIGAEASDHMKRSVLLLLAVPIVVTGLRAQRSFGGQPLAWGEAQFLEEREEWPVGALHPLGQTATQEEGTGGFRYGVQRTLQADIVALAHWTEHGDRRIARYRVASPGALMLSLQFDRWDLPEGAMVFLYDRDRTRFLGGFTQANRTSDGTMATAVLPGDEVVVEYHVPQAVDAGELRVASLTHGYRDIFGFHAEPDASRDYDPGYQSAPCHINMACPQAAPWQVEKRGVAMFLRPDGNGCTGTLVNNTQTPGRPYFLTANHCFQPNTGQWVFYFNYEAPACVGSVGPTNETLTGAVLRANDYYKDFALVELDQAPHVVGYNVTYLGWDRTGNTPQSGATIMHPLFDVKKIAIDNDPSTSTSDGDTQLWRQYWNAGLVEAVGSGAALLDQNKRVVGHMYDGPQECATATTVPSTFAKFSASWDGTHAAGRLRDWLDPANTSPTMNSYQPSAPSVTVQVRAMLGGPFDPATGQMRDGLRAAGLVPLSEPYTAAGYAHVGGGGETTTAPTLATTGPNAVVDWVVVELRNAAAPAQVVATRSALLQRDGDIMTAAGSTTLTFSMPSGSYYVAVRHRNHLGIMTATALPLSATSTTVDLTLPTTAVHGGSGAADLSAGKRVLSGGDVRRDGELRYTGENNDRDPVLQRVGGTVPTASVQGYHAEDVNMDGLVRYTGEDNDRDVILVNVGGTVPTAVRPDALP